LPADPDSTGNDFIVLKELCGGQAAPRQLNVQERERDGSPCPCQTAERKALQRFEVPRALWAKPLAVLEHISARGRYLGSGVGRADRDTLQPIAEEVPMLTPVALADIDEGA
jgi:hypothetical protein